MKKKILYFFKIFFGTVVIFYLYYTNKISLQFFSDFFNLKQLFFSITFFILFYLLSVFRWFYILKNIDKNIKFVECFKYDSSSIIFNFILPIGEISGEIYRGYLLNKEKKINMKKTIASIIIDRGSGALSLIFISILFLPFLLYFKYNTYFFFLFYLLVIFFLFKLKKFSNILLKLFSKFISYDLILLQKTILPCIIISIFSFSLYFISMIFLYENITSNFEILLKSILIFPFGLLINALPISPGGIGIGSLGFIFLSNFFYKENYIFLENGILAMQILFLLIFLILFFYFYLINIKKN